VLVCLEFPLMRNRPPRTFEAKRPVFKQLGLISLGFSAANFVPVAPKGPCKRINKIPGKESQFGTFDINCTGTPTSNSDRL
jgi:hypothetical protein